MRPLVLAGLLLASRGAAAADSGSLALARRVDLSAAFGLATPQSLLLYAPTGENAACGDTPARVCFQRGREAPACSELYAEPNSPLQTIGAVTPVTYAPGRQGMLVTASFSGCGSGQTITGLLYAHDAATDSFSEAHRVSTTELGAFRFLGQGYLAGSLVVADMLWALDDGGHFEPHRYRVSVQRPVGGLGYTEVFSYMSAARYETGESALAAELPRVETMLRATLPHLLKP